MKKGIDNIRGLAFQRSNASSISGLSSADASTRFDFLLVDDCRLFVFFCHRYAPFLYFSCDVLSEIIIGPARLEVHNPCTMLIPPRPQHRSMQQVTLGC